jgi:acyl-CoA reductase-like NAD-dependent aldehyde dehydrogenase
MTTEVPEILARALHAPVSLTFDTPDEARRWRYRVYNHIRRHAPHLAQLMMTQHGDTIRIRLPSFTLVQEDQKGEER